MGMNGKEKSAPPEHEHVEHALVIPHQQSGIRLEVLLALDLDFDVEQRASESVKASSNKVIQVDCPSRGEHRDAHDGAPC